MGRIAVAVGALLVLVAVLVWHRAAADAAAALTRAEEARAAGDLSGVVLSMGAALRANPWPAAAREVASRGLAELADSAEQAGDLAVAEAAWRELRTGWLGARAVGPGEVAWIERAEAGLVRTGAVAESTIRPDPLPGGGWSLLAGVALLGWITCTCGLLLRGLEADGRVRRGAAGRWGLASVAGLALFWLALIQA